MGRCHVRLEIFPAFSGGALHRGLHGWLAFHCWAAIFCADAFCLVRLCYVLLQGYTRVLDAAIPISDRPVQALHLISDLGFFRICCVVCVGQINMIFMLVLDCQVRVTRAFEVKSGVQVT